MYHYITWFQNNYPELHNALIACDHNYNYMHLNPYHLESDCWSHTMMVCKIAEIQGYDKSDFAFIHIIIEVSRRAVCGK